MANVTEQSLWEVGVYQIETSDPVIGGVNGIANRQALQLANRTLWLKNQIADLGTNKQPVDATLTALAGLTTSADKLIYATGADQFALTPLTAFIRSLLDDADAAAARATLGAAPLASPVLTDTPTAPTAPVGTNTTQIATTAFVNAEIAADRPFETTVSNIKMDGAQSVGAANTVARGDHVHPTDTSRVAKSGDTMTGVLKVKSGTGLEAGVKGDVDGDTGLEWFSDGILRCIVNNKARLEFNANGDYTKITNNSGQFAVFQNDGNFVVKSADSSIVWDAFGASQKYVSDDLVMTNGGQIVVNHGLGVEPMHISLYMRCVAAEMGYAVGDVIRIAGDASIDGVNEGIGVLVNNEQIVLRVGENGPQQITRKDNGSGAILTAAKWRLIVKATK